jgi:hypothetical protein
MQIIQKHKIKFLLISVSFRFLHLFLSFYMLFLIINPHNFKFYSETLIPQTLLISYHSIFARQRINFNYPGCPASLVCQFKQLLKLIADINFPNFKNPLIDPLLHVER